MRVVLAALLLALLSSAAEAATKYTRVDGHDTNCDGSANASDASTGTTACAYLTIDKLADNVSAGDTGRVQAGTYDEASTPGVSGASGNTVTLVADGVVNTCRMTITNKNYIRVIGFTFDGDLPTCTNSNRILVTGTNTGLEFWNNNLINSDSGFIMGAADRCNACIIMGGTINNINNGTNAITMAGEDAFVGYIAVDTVDYLGVVFAGHDSRFVNLNFSDFLQVGIRHPDFFFPQGSAANTLGHSRNLFESIYGIGTPDSIDNKTMHFSNSTGIDWEDNLWRQSVIFNMGSGFFSVYALNADITRTHFYNNTIVDCQRAVLNRFQCGNFDETTNTITATVKNHLFSEAWSTDVTTNLTVWSETNTPTITKDYNLADDPDGAVTFAAQWSGQANEQSNVDTLFVNPASDWTLQAGSGARGVGGHLTLAVGAGVTSTELTVTAGTGGMFVGDNSAGLPQYSGAFVPGDFITVGSTTVQVSSVSGDVITLASSISWDDAAPVYFGSSTTIDIGAYPYKTGGYALSATYTSGGGTATITPNDASLVRFVVCYNDSVPYEIDNSSPYTCSVPSGTLSAKAYPRYASSTLSIEAEPVSGGRRLRRGGE